MADLKAPQTYSPTLCLRSIVDRYELVAHMVEEHGCTFYPRALDLSTEELERIHDEIHDPSLLVELNFDAATQTWKLPED